MLRLQFVIETIDRATAGVKRVQQAIERSAEGPRRLRSAMSALWQASGATRLAERWGEVRAKAAGVRDELGNVAKAFAVVTAIGAGVALPLKAVIDQAGQLQDMSATLGASAQFLQKVGYAAELSGGSLESAGDTLRFLQKNAIEAVTGNEQLATWFQRAGISIDFLKKNLNNSEALWGAFTKGVAGADSSAKQIALSTALGGRGAAQMIATIKGGPEEFAKLGAELESFGGVLSNETVGSLDDVGDNLTRLQRAAGGVFRGIATAALPQIQQIVGLLLEWMKANRELIATKVTAFLQAVAARLPAILDGAGKVVSTIGTMIGVVDRIAQLFGGWNVVLGVVAVVMGAKLVMAIGALALAWKGFGLALLMTPLGWFALAIAGFVGLVALIVAKWTPIKAFFTGLWDGVKGAFQGAYDWIAGGVSRLIETVANGVKKAVGFLPESVRGLLGLGAPAAPAAAAAGAVATRPGATRPALPGLAAPRLTATAATTTPRPGAAAAAAGAARDVGGTLKIEFTGNVPGRPRVRQARQNSGLGFDVYSGAQMVTP
jgi:phage-related protein